MNVRANKSIIRDYVIFGRMAQKRHYVDVARRPSLRSLNVLTEASVNPLPIKRETQVSKFSTYT